MPVVERYRRWFEYERHAQAKVVSALRGVPDAARQTADFQTAVDLLAHLIAAREMWLYRFGARAAGPETLFPAGVTLAEAESRLASMEGAWVAYFGALDDAGVERVFEYTSIDGQRFRNRTEDVLTQLFGHAWYHRGQIAVRLRALGVAPPVTDFIYWCREPA